jgi:CxxC motif-containing protein
VRDQREFICVTCPVGCAINAVVEDGELVEIEGHTCKRGIAFVEEELTAPRRMLTTTVRVHGGTLPLVPVRSSEPLPKEKLLDVAARLREVVVEAPVVEHQVVLSDALGTGVDIITSRAIGPDGSTEDTRQSAGGMG